MTETMRGVQYIAPKNIEVVEVPIPEVGPDDVLIKVRAATTCGTDLKTYKRGHHEIPTGSIFGHEKAGDVVAVGKNVTKFKPGMRVTTHNSAPCGKCYFCKHGQENLCPDILFSFGAFAEYSIIPGPIAKINAFEIPDHISYEESAPIEPLSTVIHGQKLVNIQQGETVAIIGAGGPIGLMHLQLALLSGASTVIAVDLSDTRLNVAKELGATTIINPKNANPTEAIFDLTNGIGADVTIEATGALAGWQGALQAVRKGGRVLWFGGLKPEDRMELDVHKVHYGENTLYNVHHSTPIDVLNANRLINSGRINTKALISTEMPLEKTEEALLAMSRGEVVKVAIKPDLANS